MEVDGPDHYKDVSLEELRIDAIHWPDDAAEHIRSRSERRPGDLDVEPEWATEAALDKSRLIRPAGQGDTASLKVVGWSAMARRLLKVWIWSDDPAGSSEWNGGSACLANDSDRKRYEEEDR